MEPTYACVRISGAIIIIIMIGFSSQPPEQDAGSRGQGERAGGEEPLGSPLMCAEGLAGSFHGPALELAAPPVRVDGTFIYPLAQPGFHERRWRSRL